MQPSLAQITFGFSTITRLFWIRCMHRQGATSLFKIEVPESGMPVLDHRSGGKYDSRMLPVIQLKGSGWHLLLTPLIHEVGTQNFSSERYHCKSVLRDRGCWL